MDTLEFVTSAQVDLTNCDREAIHIPGHIQPHGIFIALLEPELIIVQVSKNTEQFLEISAESLINQNLNCLFQESQIDILRYCLTQENIEICNPVKLSFQVRDKFLLFDSVIHRSDGLLILELEPSVFNDDGFSLRFYHLVKASVFNIKKATDFREMTEFLAKEVRKITGFDRVMVYQFEPDDSGIVIAEDKRDDLEAFLGLHYPASDIPKQARKLYYENWLRFIVDVNYCPVEIIPTNNPLTNTSIDLSFSILRSVSPIHIKYLQNMGVSATLCISLINEQKLWGLIVGHHYSPKYVPYEIRKASELIGQMMSLEIVNKQQQEYEHYGERIKLIQEKLKNSLANKSFDSQVFLEDTTNLLNLVNATGAVVCFGDDLTCVGKTPSKEAVHNLIIWLESECQQEIFYTNSLPKVYPDVKPLKDMASGLLAISIFLNHTSYHLIWFRPEVIQTVNWAGDPNKSLSVENDGTLRLSPRGSFELWKETVRERSLPWKQIEIDAALELRNAFMLAALEFYQAAMQQAADAADAANRAKSQFLAKMSHELRTPLNAILGFTQVLARNSSLNKEQQEYLGIIGRSGEHLLSLINDVLEMSKIEAGLVTLNKNSFDLHRLLDDLEEMLQLKANFKGLQLIFERDSNIPQFVNTDESKLRQVLINLLGNAIKFTDEGCIRLQTIGSQSPTIIDNEGLTIYFTVEDTGSGIAPSEIDTVFEAFVQTETGRQSMEGTGLGLPISRQFVQLMGGDISINSSLGKGTIVKFDIKVTPAITANSQTEQSTTRAIALVPEQPPYRILVVEDSRENRQLLVKLLTSVGFEVREAENGLEAISLWSTWQPHLIWMDIQMPIVDGLEATKQIKASKITDIPHALELPEPSVAHLFTASPVIIALTASVFKEERDRILAAGCDDFVRKPFRDSEIFDKMAQYLGVRYLYEQSTLSALPQTLGTLKSLTPADLAVMSAEWIAQVHKATLCGDDELMLQLIAQIPLEQVSLANTLTDLVNNFDFEQIERLTSPNQ